MGLSGRHTAQAEMQFPKASLDVPHQGLALRCQANVSTFALEQHSSEILLKATDGVTDRARRETEVVSS
jgi:hypothetical protein